MRKTLAALLVVFLLCGVAGASDGGKEVQLGKAALSKMNLFLSNFTELGFDNITREGLSREKLIHFGIWHNYLNNFKSRIVPCKKDCKNGDLLIDGKFVAESIRKYFGIDFDAHGTVEGEMRFFFDGKAYHFFGADGEAVYFAYTTKAYDVGGGRLRLEGILYNANVEDREPEADFVAEVETKKVGGKEATALISIATKWYAQ